MMEYTLDGTALMCKIGNIANCLIAQMLTDNSIYLHALGQWIEKWLQLRQQCQPADEYDKHDGNLEVWVQSCGKHLGHC